MYITANDFCHAQTHAVFTEITDYCGLLHMVGLHSF